MFLSKKVAKVNKLLSSRQGIQKVEVSLKGERAKAINYIQYTGKIKEGDEVVLNTTAVDLGLGTGGYHFVMLNLSNPESEVEGRGHIMKLRYTPFQIKLQSVEEQSSPFHTKMKTASSLKKMPVVVCSLHSMLPCAAGAIKKLTKNKAKVGYVMTDGGALPCALSDLLDALKETGLIDVVITCGHAFGGDYEAVNVYSGLLASKHVFNCDIAITAMGPGIVGTGTKFGFTGVEQGEIINGTAVLKGIPIAVPRISFIDSRERHYGVSHHSLTVLGEIAVKKAVVALHNYNKQKMKTILTQLQKKGIDKKHRIIIRDGSEGLNFTVSKNIKLSTMGRSFEIERDYFLTAGAAGTAAVDFL